jgi:hypothetical protein
MGSVRSARKAAASRENGKLGGKPAVKKPAPAVQPAPEACSASMGSHDDVECNCQNRMVDAGDIWDGDTQPKDAQ